MTKSEFLSELREALQGEVPAGVIEDNVRYYDTYISQEAATGRSDAEIIEELGGPRIIARTIIDSTDAAGETYSEYAGQNTGSDGRGPQMTMRGGNIDLSKWYWKLLIMVVVFLVLFLVLSVMGGIFSLVFRFAGPLIVIWFIVSMFRGPRR